MLFSRVMNAINLTADLSDVETMLKILGISTAEVNVKGKEALKEITVYTCLKKLADSLMMLPIKIYQDNNGIRKATDHSLYPMIKLRPNPYMSTAAFWNCVETQRNLFGNSYVWIDCAKVGRNAGKIMGLYPLDSTRMQIYVDDVGLMSSNNKMWYVYTDNQSKQYKIKSDEILHFKGLTTNGLVGLSAIELLTNSISNAASAGKYINNFFSNGMQTKGIVQYVGDLNSKAEDNFRTKFEQMSNGLKNAHKISLLPIGYQYQDIGQKLVDAQFLENTQLTCRQIAAAFGVKLHQLNDLQKASYASISEQNREFFIDTMLPILTMYEQELNYKLLLDSELRDGYYMKFNADVMLRADIKTRYDAYNKAIQSGFKTPNEIRALEEDAPMPGGDVLLINGNIMPIEMAGAQYKKGDDKNAKSDSTNT